MKYITPLIISIALVFSSCEGEEGPRGPQGPQGEQGEPGEPGEGTETNMLDFSVTGSDWVQEGDFNDPDFRFTYEESWDILDGDGFRDYVLLGYVDVGQGFLKLPYTVTFSDYFTEVNFGWRSGHVFVSWKDSDLQTLPPGATTDFRFIALELSQYIEGMEKLPYEEVQELIN